MKKFHKVPIISTIAVFSFLSFFLYAPSISSALSPSAYLDDAVNFAVLANTPSVTNTGATTISGTAGNDVGIAPAASFTGAGTVTMTGGTVHLNDTAAQNAQTSLAAAYTTLSGLATTKPDPGVELGGQTLTAGVYAHTTFGITTTLTLDGGGDPNAIFVFKSGSTLITADGGASKVVLTNSAQACNVYWTVGSAATLGTSSILKGHVLSLAAITAKTGANIEGQLLSRDAAVTLDSNVITNNNCTSSTPTSTATPTATSTDGDSDSDDVVIPCTATIGALVFTSGGPGSTTGKLTWTTTGPGLFQFVGSPNLYPVPYNYGTLTSSWDGSLVNMVPTTNYDVAVKFVATCGLVSQASTVASNPIAVATPTPTLSQTPTPTPTPTVSETPTPTPTVSLTPTPTPVVTVVPTPPATEVGGKLPKTSTPWYSLLVGAMSLLAIGTVGLAFRRRRA